MTMKGNKIRRILQALLSVASLAWIVFILANSLQTGEQSSAQSAEIVDKVQEIAQVIAPESAIANATGKEYDILHDVIRNCAHFAEFAVLGALLCWCYFAYTFRKETFYLPLCAIAIVPLLDEGLQAFVVGRGWELKDLALDICGGVMGLLVAMLCVYIGLVIYKNRLRKRMQK